MFETLVAIRNDLGLEGDVSVTRSLIPDRFLLGPAGGPILAVPMTGAQILAALREMASGGVK